mmetsp:Transcript_34356/g.61938  ORF Transcript_34356/g.61938 Transcript_34356/m.61938 type:complete len:246 (+) Transcript_34356:265-1002(+)
MLAASRQCVGEFSRLLLRLLLCSKLGLKMGGCRFEFRQHLRCRPELRTQALCLRLAALQLVALLFKGLLQVSHARLHKLLSGSRCCKLFLQVLLIHAASESLGLGLGLLQCPRPLLQLLLQLPALLLAECLLPLSRQQLLPELFPGLLRNHARCSFLQGRACLCKLLFRQLDYACLVIQLFLQELVFSLLLCQDHGRAPCQLVFVGKLSLCLGELPLERNMVSFHTSHSRSELIPLVFKPLHLRL